MEKPNPIPQQNHFLAADSAIIRPSLAPNSSRESSTIGLTNESITDADGASGNFYRINLQTSSADTRTKEDPSQQCKLDTVVVQEIIYFEYAAAVTRDRFLDFEDVSHLIEFDASSSKPESVSAPSLALNDQSPSLFLVCQPELRKLQVQIAEQEKELKYMEEHQQQLKKENEVLKEQNQLYKAQNEEKLGIINQLRSELNISEKKRDILMKQIVDKQQFESEFNKMTNKNNAMQQQMDKIKESYENKITGYMNLIDDLNSQILRIENQLQQQQRQSLHSFQALKDQNQTLEGQIAQLQQQSSANSSVNKSSDNFSLSSKPQSPKKKKKLPESSLNFLKQQILLNQSLIKNKVMQQQQKSKSKQTQQQFLNQTLPLPNNYVLSPINDSNQKPCPSPLTDQYLHFILNNSQEKPQNLQEQIPIATQKKIINKNSQNKRSQSQQSQRSRSPISEFEVTQKLNMRNYDLNQHRNSMVQTLGRLDFEKILGKKTKRSSQNVTPQANTFSINQGKSPLNVPKSSKSFDKTSIKDIFLSNVHPRNSSALSSLSEARSNSLKGKTPVLDSRKMSQGSNEQRFNQTMGLTLNEAKILVSPSPQIKWLPSQIPKQVYQSFEDTQHSIASSEFQISHDQATKSLNGSLNSTLQFPLEVFSSQMKNSKPPKRSSSRNESSLNSSLNIPSSSQYPKQQLTDAHLFSILTSCKNSGSCASSTRSSTDQYSTHHSSSFSTQKVLDQLAKFADPSLPKKSNLNKSLQHSQNKTHQISYEEAPQSQMIDQQIQYVNQNPSILNYLGNTSTSNQFQSHLEKQQQQQQYPNNYLQNPDDSNLKNIGKTNLNRTTTIFSPLSSIQSDFLTLEDQNQAFMKMSTTSKNSSQSRVPSTKPTNVPKVPKTKSNNASNNTSLLNKFQPNKIMSVDDFCFSDILSSKARSNYDNTPMSQSSNACSTASSALTSQPKPQIKTSSKQQFSKNQRKSSISKPPYSGTIYDQQPYQQSLSFYEGSEIDNSQSYCDVTNYLENHAMEGNSQPFEKEISQKNQAIANLSQAHFRSRSEQAQYKNSSGGSSKSSSRNGQNSNQTNKIIQQNASNKQSQKNSRNSNQKDY